MKTNYKRIPFNIELAKKITNKEVKGQIVTQCGYKVRIICWDKKPFNKSFIDEGPIVVLAKSNDGGELLYTCTEKGLIPDNNTSFKDRYTVVIDIPEFYEDYSNFIPKKGQSCVVRDTSTDLWRVAVCKYSNSTPSFYSINTEGNYCYWAKFLPLTKVTEHLIGTNKSYKELIDELNKE